MVNGQKCWFPATLLYPIGLWKIYHLPDRVNPRSWKTKHFKRISPLVESINARSKHWHLFCFSVDGDGKKCLPDRKEKQFLERQSGDYKKIYHRIGYGKGMEKQGKTTALAAQRLVTYGNENPMASDTAEGIAKWCIKMPVDEVLPALESLVDFGVWEKLLRNDRVIYRPVRFSESKKK